MKVLRTVGVWLRRLLMDDEPHIKGDVKYGGCQ